MTAFQGWLIGGSQPYNGKWAHHWGVDISTFGTSKSMCFLVNDIHSTTIRYGITGTSTTTTIDVYGVGGSVYNATVTSSAINTYTFIPSSYSSPYPAVNSQGYGVYVIVLTTTYAGANQYRVLLNTTAINENGLLWVHDKNGSYYSANDAGTVFSCRLLEAITGNVNATQNGSFSALYSLIRCDVTTYAQSGSIFNNSISLRETTLPTGYSSLATFYAGCNTLQKAGTSAYVCTTLTTLNAAFQNCWAYIEAINITCTSLTNFGANNDMRSVPSIEVDAPLTTFVVNNAFSAKKIIVKNTNFKAGATNVTVIDIRNTYAMTEAEHINMANEAEDLTGQPTKTISKAGSGGFTATVTALWVAKNYTVI